MIPKLVHHIWIQGAEACPFRDNIARCRSGTDGIDFRLWDDTTIRPLFRRFGGPDLEKIYDAEPTFAGKSDIARYLIVYLEGGFYLDTDYRCVRSPALWIDQFGGTEGIDLVVVHDGEDAAYRFRKIIHKHHVINGLFGAAAGHPMMTDCIRVILQKKGRGNLLERTGTILFGNALRRYFTNHPETVVLLPRAYFFPVSFFNHETMKKSTRFLPLMIHENSLSWSSGFNRRAMRLSPVVYAWSAVVLVLVVVLVVLLSVRQWLAAGLFALLYAVLVIVVTGLVMRWFTASPRFPNRRVLRETKRPGATRLMIVCHPDDELLFGGLALLRLDGWKVLCLTNGGNERRSAEFRAAMDRIDGVWAYEMWDHADQAMAGRLDAGVEAALRKELADRRYEMVLTHNWRGEYGHAQHRLVGTLLPRLVASGLWVFWDTQGGHGAASAEERERLTALLKESYPSQYTRVRRHVKKAHRYWILRVA